MTRVSGLMVRGLLAMPAHAQEPIDPRHLQALLDEERRASGYFRVGRDITRPE